MEGKIGMDVHASKHGEDRKEEQHEKSGNSSSTSFGRGSGSTDRTESFCSSHLGTCFVNKPHKANDANWQAINLLKMKETNIGLGNFRLLRRVGAGDIGTVYHAQLKGTTCQFAIKVIDKDVLKSRKKLIRAHTEREILTILDHPFLPTMYTYFETEKFLCLVMEYCSGGDLHNLRQKQPKKYFSESAARFYASEVLVALEYLHMMGIIYRDLKPENVLVREEGHIMLSDFDLSLRCSVSPQILKATKGKKSHENSGTVHADSEAPECFTHTCIHPHCLLPRLTSHKSRRKLRERCKFPRSLPFNLPEFLAEPSSARSMSFVGTHEYLAPEIIKGEGHGSAVDWWTYGIFLYELLHGITPFKGENNHGTLLNVVGQPLKFPDSTSVSHAAKDLIRGLLVKDPQQRLAYVKGAAEIKHHPFFEGVNWALIRSTAPPRTPAPPHHKKSHPKTPAHTAGASSNRASDSDSLYIDFTNLF